VGVKVMVKKES